MYDNLTPKTIQPSEAMALVSLSLKNAIKIIPQRCCVLLIKGPMDNESLMSLARKYKDASWVAPKQNEITFKFLLTKETKGIFNEICIFDEEQLVKTYGARIYSTGLVLIKRRERDRMLRGLSLVRAGDVPLYFSHEEDNDESVQAKLDDITSLVTETINQGFILLSNICNGHAKDPESTRRTYEINEFFTCSIEKGSYEIFDTTHGRTYFQTSSIFDFLYRLPTCFN